MSEAEKRLASYLHFRVLPFESQEEFEALLGEYRKAFAPMNGFENMMVEDMAAAHWRTVRFRRIEAHVATDQTALKKIRKYTLTAQRGWRVAERCLRQSRPHPSGRRSRMESPERRMLRDMAAEGRLPPYIGSAKPEAHALGLETLFGDSDPFAPRA